jgi:hypothetical protein
VPAGRIRVLPADLADEQDRSRAVAAALAAGGVDILVNNAATVEPLGPSIGIAAADLRLAFEVNVVTPAALTVAVLPGMLDVGCVTVNAYRPGGVDTTTMQAWIRSQAPERVGALHERFNKNFAEGTLITPSIPPRRCWPTWPATIPGPSGTSAPPQ